MSHRDGLALRSLVYHEILSAYLNYVKARGYTSMFIWACPPMAVSTSAQLAERCLAAMCMPWKHIQDCLPQTWRVRGAFSLLALIWL